MVVENWTVVEDSWVGVKEVVVGAVLDWVRLKVPFVPPVAAGDPEPSVPPLVTATVEVTTVVLVL
jgi:hypothetical protein